MGFSSESCTMHRTLHFTLCVPRTLQEPCLHTSTECACGKTQPLGCFVLVVVTGATIFMVSSECSCCKHSSLAVRCFLFAIGAATSMAGRVKGCTACYARPMLLYSVANLVCS